MNYPEMDNWVVIEIDSSGVEESVWLLLNKEIIFSRIPEFYLQTQ
jgi:hypothetical protein